IQYSVNTDRLSFQDDAGNEERACNGGEIVNSPAQPAQIIRIVEAITPAAAKRASIKAEITVKMLVAKDGKVEDASIEEIRLYTGNDGYKIVDDIDYNLKKATLKLHANGYLNLRGRRRSRFGPIPTKYLTLAFKKGMVFISIENKGIGPFTKLRTLSWT